MEKNTKEGEFAQKKYIIFFLTLGNDRDDAVDFKMRVHNRARM